MNILLVSPRTPATFWSFRHILPMVARRAAFPPLGLITVAAMLPREWSVRLVDLDTGSLSDAQIAWADYVMLSGMIVHEPSARVVARRCQAMGKPVIAGGPLFTSGHERFPEIPHFVLGEAEALLPELVADLRSGRPKHTYRSDAFPDVGAAPIPRWELLNLRHYVSMSVQFSRGCPFDCEFCDVIVMNGRRPRVKSPGQMIAELEALHAAGWRGPVFVVDDNLIGNRARIKTLLRELIAWRTRRDIRTTFTTEASINLADDAELIDLMVRAGFKRVFVGIESPQAESLLECSKVQNTRRDLVASVRKLHQSGLEVMGGFIVGFDQDKADIFERQLGFIREAGVVTAMVGLLNALPKTRLAERLEREGRLLTHSTGNNLDAVLNFVPRLDRSLLIDGYRRLVRELYNPREYYARIRTFLRDYRPSGPRYRATTDDVMAFFRSLWMMGVAARGRTEFWKFLATTLWRHPRALSEALTLAISGHHFRRVAAGL